MNNPSKLSRRRFLGLLGTLGLTAWLRTPLVAAQSPATVRTKPIPSSGERVPLVGLGSWITFNVGNDPIARDACASVMRRFFEAGGRMIDSSPMYGSSQDVIGFALQKLDRTAAVFSADKLWTPFFSEGQGQIEESRRKWGVARFDLMQVHNLVDWEQHLPALFERKAAGTIRYVGITTSESRRLDRCEQIMRNHPLDFVQVSYNIRNREVERRILPLARDRGMAVIANRPFQQGQLIDWAERHPLPEWSSEIDCANWAQFLLKFIVSHPSITCAIPATTRTDHVHENMGAAVGRLPDETLRRRMARYVEQLE